MTDSNSSFRDMIRAKNSAPSQGWQGPRTKWSGTRDNSSSYVDPHPAPPSGPSSANPYSSSGPYASSHQQNVASGINDDAGHSRSRDAGSRFAERYSGQRNHRTDPPPAEPKKGGWSSWLGGNKSSEPKPTDSRAHEPEQKSHSRGSEERQMPDRPRRGRYIPPSERKPGDPMFEPVAPPPKRGPRTTDSDDEDEPDPNDNSWGAWASRQTKAANVMMQQASDKLNEGWDSVNDANKRDKALTNVGNGAVNAAGTAVKYTAKGIWNVGKAAMK
ncbi:hypothetical protein CcaverHIS002_0704460 [Cutaneotrichosporon cavernicola]|uniref:Uncharacterized protein n=1 Tax=Cutaneotrichosporon cavernicola TaxID=279322 RepID=A0AA48LAJ5_9TREE|nr:uncharacterized protein CcaverHIS019_0704540 [Cutaneotrichosporon cavernicola]BEI87100.1 hypothetical protein CcaverHIS002_0704460 [Cutaneotrichosporon cavernicola]BEI94873.1 hypothetical protein CcaverHIS019_0704540 [Cutaneotrichosporon cavernicola]BEJ02646.1 hypothetical protein CcaverHIS631_0704410 [Cutaneotrichosporon cavernicola]BEJ10402.1 hypothetical protein CcaverHIS641_0704370 [Cutaneotrichosporon cavernicola]